VTQRGGVRAVMSYVGPAFNIRGLSRVCVCVGVCCPGTFSIPVLKDRVVLASTEACAAILNLSRGPHVFVSGFGGYLSDFRLCLKSPISAHAQTCLKHLHTHASHLSRGFDGIMSVRVCVRGMFAPAPVPRALIGAGAAAAMGTRSRKSALIVGG
jgi:hypothetical protein